MRQNCTTNGHYLRFFFYINFRYLRKFHTYDLRKKMLVDLQMIWNRFLTKKKIQQNSKKRQQKSIGKKKICLFLVIFLGFKILYRNEILLKINMFFFYASIFFLFFLLKPCLKIFEELHQIYVWNLRKYR